MPVTIVDQESTVATRFPNQRKVFRNPRGLKYYYALVYYRLGTTYELRLYRSPDGVTWTDYTFIHDFGSDIFHSASLWWDDDGTKLILYFIYTDTNYNMYFRRGTILDGSPVVSLGVEQTWTSDVLNKWFAPDVCKDRLGYLWLIFRRVFPGVPYTKYTNLYVDAIITYLREWTEVGVEPFLDAEDYPYHYVKTNTKLATEGDFSFEDITPTESLDGVVFYIRSRQLGTGESIEITVFDGEGGSLTFTITPNPTTFSWLTYDLTGFLNTWAKVNNATFRMVYRATGKADIVEVDCAYLRIQHTVIDPVYGVRCMATTQPIEQLPDPDAPTWGDELTLLSQNTEKVDLSCPTIKPYGVGVTPQVLAVYPYYTLAPTAYYIQAKEVSWDGTSFTEHIVDEVVGGDEINTIPSLVIADNNGYVAFRRRSTIIDLTVYSVRVWRWITGTGFSGVWTLWDDARTDAVISFDTSKGELYVFGSEFAPNATKTVYQKANIADMIWSDPVYIDDDGEALDHFSSSVFDDNGKIQVIYTTQTTALIRFLEIVPVVVPRMAGEGLTWIVA